jgi:hypothetical protein
LPRHGRRERRQQSFGATHLGRARAQPHLVKTFKLSNDPRFIEKLEDAVGLYMNPPEHALALSVMPEACVPHDEKSQIQAQDRTQPGLPMKKGRAGTMTHDDKRNPGLAAVESRKLAAVSDDFADMGAETGLAINVSGNHWQVGFLPEHNRFPGGFAFDAAQAACRHGQGEEGAAVAAGGEQALLRPLERDFGMFESGHDGSPNGSRNSQPGVAAGLGAKGEGGRRLISKRLGPAVAGRLSQSPWAAEKRGARDGDSSCLRPGVRRNETLRPAGRLRANGKGRGRGSGRSRGRRAVG